MISLLHISLIPRLKNILISEGSPADSDFVLKIKKLLQRSTFLGFLIHQESREEEGKKGKKKKILP